MSEKCSRCGLLVGYELIACPTCYTPLGPPNVRLANSDAEKNALNSRYDATVKNAISKGTWTKVQEFETGLDKSMAIAATDIHFIGLMLRNPKTLYSTYQRQVQGETRLPADFENDRIRRTVEARLYGLHGSNITYAALSLDGKGLISYGDFALELDPLAFAHRASLLEENSFDFMKRHNIQIIGSDLPHGYSSTWEDRAKLCVAKLADSIKNSYSVNDFAEVLLRSDGNRQNDSFVEIHIFGTFNSNAIKFIRYKKQASTTKKIDQKIATLKDLCKQQNIPLEEF